MEKGIRLAVFDMAGTTLQDNHEVEACFAKAASETKLEVSSDEILAAQGWSKRFVFETFWERQVGERNAQWEQEVAHSYEVFKHHLEDHYLKNPVQPTVGCLEVFDYLKKHDVCIALTTGFYRKIANIILDKLGWLDGLDEEYMGKPGSLIQMSITGDEVAHGRPAPDMIFKAMEKLGVTDSSQVLKVGDTPSDLKAGKAANCGLVLGVTNGTHSKEQLQGYDAHALIAPISQIISIIEEKHNHFSD